MNFTEAIESKAVDLVGASLEMTTEASSGHPTSAASLAHLVTVLLYEHMRWDPGEPDARGADRLILSEGHACPIVYAAAADRGVRLASGEPMDTQDAHSLRAIDSEIEGHPNPREGFPFFDSATGSLGQGLSHAAGLALAARLDELPSRFFVLIGDGEAREGQIGEALDFLRDHALQAVCPIFNCNGLAQSDAVASGQTADALRDRLEALGFEVHDIDGHDPDQIKRALGAHMDAHENGGRLVAIVARTVKGWGTPSLQGQGHHGKAVDPDELPDVLDELDGEFNGASPDPALSTPPVPPSPAREDTMVRTVPSFREALETFGLEDWVKDDELPTRKAYGVALRALGHARNDVVALDGDVKNSTYTEQFADDPALAHRYFEGRIAEQNMVSVGAGLALEGKIPFVSSFGKFLTRAYDQIEMALLGGAALRLVGSHCGISLAADGPSQMALPDVAWFRSLSTVRVDGDRPLIHVLTPSDPVSAYALTVAMAEGDGAVYLRTLRPAVPIAYGPDDTFTIGGHQVRREGRDLLIIATGYMVHVAEKAVEVLAEDGIDAGLVDLYSLPFDEDAIVERARASGGRVLTVEDNFGNAAGSAVADACARSEGAITVEQMTVERLPKSGRSPEDLLRHCGLSVEDIVRRARNLRDRGSR